MALNINNAALTEYSGLDAHSIDQKTVNTVQAQEETEYMNERASIDWGYFLAVPKLKSAILTKSIWTVGKGYTADNATLPILRRISGNGKETFNDILFSMDVGRQIFRDSFAEIIRDKETGELLNLKVLDPSSIKIIYGRNGRILRYEQMTNAPTKGLVNKIKNLFIGGKTVFATYEPDEMFHLSRNRFAGSMHGISVPETVEKIILADDENFNIMQRLTRFQAVPFIIFKVKSDVEAKITTLRTKIKNARNTGEDLVIPDDENLLSWEVVNVSPSAVLMEWRNNVNSEFYRAVGLPLILFGSSGTTESGGKIEYLAHETVFEHDQAYIEKQVEAQLGLKINLIPPTSLLENLQADESKDQQNAITFSRSDASVEV